MNLELLRKQLNYLDECGVDLKAITSTISLGGEFFPASLLYYKDDDILDRGHPVIVAEGQDSIFYSDLTSNREQTIENFPKNETR